MIVSLCYFYLIIKKKGLMESNYEILPLEFKFRGSMFIQLRRQGNICMYERRDDDGYKCWEVIKTRVKKGGVYVIGGVEVEFKTKELYPSDENFGLYGWSYGDMVGAEERYRKMLDIESLRVA